MSEDKVELLSTPYGEVAYETFRELGRAFVDKSSVIKDLEDSKTPLYPVLLRPRRFGKSTFVQMLKCFYDISYKDRYEEIFNGKNIYTANLSSHNTYHVINFDFSMVNSQSNTSMLNSFFSAVATGIDDFMIRYPDFVFDYSELDKSDSVTLFNNFASAYSKYAKNCFTKGSIGRLYVMIDEYDNFANQILSQNIKLFRTITGDNGFLKGRASVLQGVDPGWCSEDTVLKQNVPHFFGGKQIGIITHFVTSICHIGRFTTLILRHQRLPVFRQFNLRAGGAACRYRRGLPPHRRPFLSDDRHHAMPPRPPQGDRPRRALGPDRRRGGRPQHRAQRRLHLRPRPDPGDGRARRGHGDPPRPRRRAGGRASLGADAGRGQGGMAADP